MARSLTSQQVGTCQTSLDRSLCQRGVHTVIDVAGLHGLGHIRIVSCVCAWDIGLTCVNVDRVVGFVVGMFSEELPSEAAADFVEFVDGAGGAW